VTLCAVEIEFYRSVKYGRTCSQKLIETISTYCEISLCIAGSMSVWKYWCVLSLLELYSDNRIWRENIEHWNWATYWRETDT